MERAQSWEPLLTIWCQGENSVFQWKGPTVSSSRFWMARLVMKATASPRLLSWVVCWMRHSTSFASKGAVSFLVSSCSFMVIAPFAYWIKFFKVRPLGIRTFS